MNIKVYKRKSLVIIFFILITVFPIFAYSLEPTSQNYDETFQYRLSWNGIRAGTAWLGIKKDGDKIKVFSRVRSASFISVFYEVDDTVESTLEPVNGLYPGKPIHYRIKLKEGKHRRDKEVIFKGNIAIYKNNLKNETHEAKIPEEIFDPLSAFFYVRFMPLEPGKSVFITVFDSKKVWDVEVKVLRREKIEIGDKEVDTIVIKPLMQSEGIFYRKGDIYIWLTDDSSRLPVMLRTKVLIGSVVATMERD